MAESNVVKDTVKTVPAVDHAKNANLFESTIASIDWKTVIKGALSWMYPLVNTMFPWIGKAAGVLGKVVVMVEKAAVTNPETKAFRLQNAVDSFERYLVSENIVPGGIEKLFDPIFDWAIIKAVNGIIGFLNATYGHNWIDIFSKPKTQN